MDRTLLLLLVLVAAFGLAAVITILLRSGRDAGNAGRDETLGASTEGEKVCSRCGGGNLWTDAACIHCGAPLRG